MKVVPCQSNRGHLGIQTITISKLDEILNVTNVRRKFFLAHGLKPTTDPKEAADTFLFRDHKKILSLLKNYHGGKLGVYMVPPMFFGEVPQAIILSEYNVAKHLTQVRGDTAESKVFHALNKYFTASGDDVLIIHSHKFLDADAKGVNNEKDFVIFNLTKGNSFEMEKTCLWRTYLCLKIRYVFGYSEKATNFLKIFHLKGSPL